MCGYAVWKLRPRIHTEDENKSIWIGTVDGVSKYDRKKFTNYTINNGLKENKVFHIYLGLLELLSLSYYYIIYHRSS